MADRLKILEYRFRCCDLNLEMLFRDEVQKRNNPAENLCLFNCDGEQNAYENRNLIPYANGEKSKNVSIWSERVAEMTAGYLPGDLIRLIRKAEGE